MKTKEIILLVILILLGIGAFFLVKHNPSSKTNFAQSAQEFDLQDWEESLPTMGLKDWCGFANDLKLDDSHKKLVDIVGLEALVRDMAYNSQDATYLEYELNVDSLSQYYESLLPELLSTPAGKECAQECIQLFQEDSYNVDRLYQAAYYFIVSNYSFEQYVPITEEEFAKAYEDPAQCSLDVPRYSTDVDSVALDSIVKELKVYYQANYKNPVTKVTTANYIARMCFDGYPLSENIYYLNQSIFDKDITVFDYEAYQLWIIALQCEHGFSRTSYIPYGIHEAARYACLHNAFKALAKNPKDYMCANFVFQYATMPGFSRHGQLGNETFDLIYKFGLIDPDLLKEESN